MPGGVFISYRREDSAGFTGRIYDRLTKRLGRDRVFLDVDNIPPGLDFVDVLSERVGRCDALIAVIGPHWITAADQQERRRIHDPHDFVRIEIEAALTRGVRVIPVLVDGAAMPRRDDLPDSLQALTRRQWIIVSHAQFDSDVRTLTRAVSSLDDDSHSSSEKAHAGRTEGGRGERAQAEETTEDVLRVLASREPQPARQGDSAPKSPPSGAGGLVTKRNAAALGAVAVLVVAAAVFFVGWRRPQPVIARAQAPPTSASTPSGAGARPAQAGISRFLGTWANVDSNTRSIPTFSISLNGADVSLHVWGACHPTPCDWGEAKAETFGPTVSSSALNDATVLQGVYNHGFSITNLTVRLEGDDGLRLETETQFTDKSGRSNYSTSDAFKRAQ